VPFNAEQIKHTLSTILTAQGEALAGEVLDTARAEIGMFDHDFNVDLYRLDLRIPAVRFAIFDKTPKQLEGLEKKILGTLWKLGINGEGHSLTTVRILPEMTVGPGAVAIALPTPSDENRIWLPGKLHLFLSHVSAIKVETAALKTALAPLGIDCFVAHEDIEPTREWHREIEFALRSMHSLCALITSGYNGSKWCDQEVGYALGRAVPVVLISCDADPYGLMGKHQALRGKLSAPEVLAGQIFDVLAKQEQLRVLLTEGIVGSLENAHSYAHAKAAAKRIASFEKHLSRSQILRMLVATRENSQVRDAINVPSQIQGIASRANVSLPKVKEHTEPDDDIPF
jgi:hypothetical protein